MKDEDIEQINWRPYAFERFDNDEIMRRLDLLNPFNSFVIFASKEVEKE
jgi:hypothetical protein